MTLDDFIQSRATFLQRNWVKGIKACQNSAAMGNIVSSPVSKAQNGLHFGARGAPPRKRQRLGTPDSMDIDHIIASPDKTESRSALRIEVLKIFHKDSDSRKVIKPDAVATAPRDLLITKGHCRITISDVSSKKPRVLHCQSQDCEIKTFRNLVEPHRVARVQAEPFYVPERNLRVRRRDDGSFEMADSYELLIELEADDQESWPPLTASDFGLNSLLPDLPQGSEGSVILSGRFHEMSGKLKGTLALSSDYASHYPVRQTSYIIETHLKWATGFRATGVSEKGSMPCITAIDPDANFGGHDPFNAENDESGEEEGERTPSRSLRTRGIDKVYNLKQLSDKARGREKKRARKVVAQEGAVIYYLPSDQPVHLDNFRCITCGAFHQSIPQLQAHMQTNHPDNEYVLETTKEGPQFRVSKRFDPNATPSKLMQLRRNPKPFVLSSFIEGDQSWMQSRLGPEPIRSGFPPSPSKRILHSQPQPNSLAPRVSNPGHRTRKSKDGTILIPKSTQPLYHPISKAVLKPGDKVPDISSDNSWLLQKHRDAIAEFTDVSAAEMEYVWEWDRYILNKNLTTSKYFPRAWKGFVSEKADWLVEEPSRMIEFAKHASVMMSRDVLTDADFKDAFTYINGARDRLAAKRRELQDVEMSGVEASVVPAPPKYGETPKSASGCKLCGLPVMGPQQLLCSNKVSNFKVHIAGRAGTNGHQACTHRIYHSSCISETAVIPVTTRRWRCNDCAEPS